MPSNPNAGRKPIPSGKRLEDGLKANRPLPVEETGEFIPATEGIPPIPDGLGSDGVYAWNRIWSAGSSYLNDDQDYLLIEQLAFAFDEMQMVRRALALGAAGGGVDRTYRMSNGAIANHPYVGQLRELRKDISSDLSKLGFTPTDRVKLGLTETMAENPALAFMTAAAQRRGA